MIIPPVQTQARYVMGTLVEVRCWAEPETALRAAAAAFAEVRRLQALLSRFEPESELNRLHRQAGEKAVSVSADLFAVLSGAREIAEASGGAFDFTCGAWMELWQEAVRQGRLPTEEETREARQRVGWNHVRLDPSRRAVRLDRPGIRLDLGAAGKGCAVDAAVRILQAEGVSRGLVDAGGNFKIFGFDELQSAGVEDPTDPDSLCATVDMVLPAIASSANSTRFAEIRGRRYGHVLDPRTGWPIEAARGATVLADSAFAADCLSTALMVDGADPDALLGRFHAEGLLIEPGSEDGPRCRASKGLAGYFELLAEVTPC